MKQFFSLFKQLHSTIWSSDPRGENLILESTNNIYGRFRGEVGIGWLAPHFMSFEEQIMSKDKYLSTFLVSNGVIISFKYFLQHVKFSDIPQF